MNHIELAISQLNVQESPKNSNKGYQVELYLNSVGLKGGQPWCMAFVYWCIINSSIGIDTKLLKTGHVKQQYNYCKQLKLVNSKPSIGDIFIIIYKDGISGHTGFVERIEGLYIYTIEGNTNDIGSREGYEVCRRKRLISECKGFIKVIL